MASSKDLTTPPSHSQKSEVEITPVRVMEDRFTSISKARRNILLAIYCLAQFLDTFNNSALFAAIPPISAHLNISNSISVWLLSAYQLTFAAFLLTSGRLSDVYDSSYVFITGTASMGLLGLGAGFVRSQVPLIVLRALMGIGASLTVPSALQLIVSLYPDPAEQAKAVSIFAATSGIGNVLGLIIGALLVTFASWPWVFYFVAIVGLLSAILAFVFTPKGKSKKLTSKEKLEKLERLDFFGVSILTAALVLFIFAVTSGSATGWDSARVIAPLIISIVLAAVFFWWETVIPERLAALPPKMWRYQNFGILVSTALVPFLWWGAVMLLFSWLWQEVYGWSTIITALHFLPISLFGLPSVALVEKIQNKVPAKFIILAGLTLALAGTVLLPFANAENRYWPFAFPGFCLGTAGVTIVFTTTNIVLFSVTPPEVAGIVGAMFNCALELGCAAGAAIITSIQTSVDVNHGGSNSYTGRAAGFWFLFAFIAIELFAVLIFMQTFTSNVKAVELTEQQAQSGAQELSFLSSNGPLNRSQEPK